jgi:hypothetical protein
MGGWNQSVTDWTEVVSTPDFGDQVVQALVRYFRESRALLAPATLVDATSEIDPYGVPVLRAVYDHGSTPKRLGLRRRLDREPMVDDEKTPAQSLAAEIAVYEISEPIGRHYDLLVEEADGVWWWGDGYPDLSEHPDFNVRSGEVRSVPCLLWASFEPLPRGLTEGTLDLSADGATWTASGTDEPLAFLAHATVHEVTSDGDREPDVHTKSPSTESGAVLMPSPVTVTCITSSGRLGIVVSPSDVAIVTGFLQMMTG